jgi:predicted nucleic acid-binding protein
MPGATYDTGALIAVERRDRRMLARHAWLVQRDIVPTVPAPVVAEAWRGGSRGAALARLLATCEVDPLTDEQARRVGELAGAAGHHDVVDVTVVEGAARRHDVVLTSDAEDIAAIARAASVALVIEAV